MSTTSTIAVSGMKVAELRLQVSASEHRQCTLGRPVTWVGRRERLSHAAYVPRRINQTATVGGATNGRIDIGVAGLLAEIRPDRALRL